MYMDDIKIFAPHQKKKKKNIEVLILYRYYSNSWNSRYDQNRDR